MIELPIKIKITSPNIIMRNLSEKNKNNFYNKIQNANWTHLYTYYMIQTQPLTILLKKLKEYAINVFLWSHKLLNINRAHG